MELNIEKILVINTKNITKEDSDRLRHDGDLDNVDEGYDEVIVYPYSYGFFITITGDEELENYSTAFRDIMKAAEEAECHQIKIDKDTPLVKGLKTFNW